MTIEPYRNVTLSTGGSVEDLLSRMTLEEKTAQLGCAWVTSLIDADGFNAEKAHKVAPFGIGEVTRIGGATGLRPIESAALMNQV